MPVIDWEVFYGRCWDILAEHAGAHNDEKGYNRGAFIFHMLKDDDFGGCHEYRFGGSLGFGGKFRRNNNLNGTVYVDYYSEDHTPKSDKVVVKVNDLLKTAQEELVGGPVFGCPVRHAKRAAARG